MNQVKELCYDVKHRIRYADTDQMGVVYYGNYALLYEIGRSELMRAHGVSYSEIEKNGTMMPVIEMNSKYLRPLYYDDLITIKTYLKKKPAVSIDFHTEIFDSHGELCNIGFVKLCFMGIHNRQLKRIPDEILIKLWNSQ